MEGNSNGFTYRKEDPKEMESLVQGHTVDEKMPLYSKLVLSPHTQWPPTAISGSV